MGRMDKKRVFITAAGQGIGRATALAMAAQGAEVIASDLDPALLEDLGAQGIEARALDLLDAGAIRDMADEIGAVDALISCGGYVANGTILDCDDAAFEASAALNVTASYRLIRAFLPAMIEGGGGSIVSIASVVSSIVAAPNRFVYGVTKAALIGMVKSVAADFVSDGIRCNAICPGTVETPSLHERLRATGDYEAAMAAFTARQPMGRLGTAKEIAALAVYLASDEAAFTTGQAHVVDGGWAMV
ncbi:MAG: SDR family oxidoreductase [Pseudomonadota bacterium]